MTPRGPLDRSCVFSERRLVRVESDISVFMHRQQCDEHRAAQHRAAQHGIITLIPDRLNYYSSPPPTGGIRMNN